MNNSSANKNFNILNEKLRKEESIIENSKMKIKPYLYGGAIAVIAVCVGEKIFKVNISSIGLVPIFYMGGTIPYIPTLKRFYKINRIEQKLQIVNSDGSVKRLNIFKR